MDQELLNYFLKLEGREGFTKPTVNLNLTPQIKIGYVIMAKSKTPKGKATAKSGAMPPWLNKANTPAVKGSPVKKGAAKGKKGC